MKRSLSRRAVLVGALAGGSAALTGCTALPPFADTSPAPSTWLTHGFDAANTGYAPDRSAVPADGTVRWQVDENDVPVVVDGTVYQEAAARAADTGERRWDGPGPGATTAAPAPTVSDGSCYTLDGTPAAHDTEDGTERWRTDDIVGGVASLRVTDDGVFGVATGGRDGAPQVFALDPSDGRVRWTESLPVAPKFAPAVADGVVVAGGWERSPDRGVVVAVSTDGERLWQAETSDRLWSEPTVGDGAVFVGDRGGTVQAVGLQDGSVRWTRSPGRVPRRFCYGDGRLYAWADGLAAFDSADGTTAWHTEVDAEPAAVDEGAVYCISRDRFSIPRWLVVVDRDAGGETWRHRFPTVTRGDISRAGVRGRPALVDGALFVAAADGTYAFEPAEG